MSILNNSVVPVGSTGYDIPKSLRFRSSATAYLTRTPATAGNRKTWTFSAWIKRCNISNGAIAYRSILSAYVGGSTYSDIAFAGTNQDRLRIYQQTSGADTWYAESSMYFRDPSAWYHIVVAFNDTLSSSSDRIKLYVNGVQQTFDSYTAPAQNTDYSINSTTGHYINYIPSSTPNDMYMAEANFIDGQALTPADFGETDATYGHWKAIEYAGTYGTNGFYLDFKDSGSLGNDANGSNNWTPTNLAATDQMIDSPTNNFATLNPLDSKSNITLAEGNLKYIATGGWYNLRGSMFVSSGKWYWEMVKTTSTSIYTQIGAATSEPTLTEDYGDAQNGMWVYSAHNGTKIGQGTSPTSYGASYATGDVMGIALDMDNGTITFYKNNVSQGQAFSGITGDVAPWISGYNNNNVYNFGQDSSFAGAKTAQGNQDGNGIGDFYYAPPAGFLALCTKNLPEPTVVPNRHFNAVLWTGTTSVDRDITGIGFDPSLVWIKSRSDAYEHIWFDKVRGAGKRLISQNTNAESTNDSTLNAFITDGFTLGNGSAVDLSVNGNTSKTYVAWNWKANGAGVSNTNGSITSTVSANVDAGFSIVSYTGTGALATVGHGLNLAPEMVIVKNRSVATSTGWIVYNSTLGGTKFLILNGTAAEGTATTVWNDTAPTASLFSLGVNGDVNQVSTNLIAYCFHSVDGYSKVGSYTGNGSIDGTFVYTGFSPAYVMIKMSSSTSNWVTYDNKRDTYNAAGQVLYANTNGVESDDRPRVDFVSNGFKLRNASEPNWVSSTIIFIAFAEQPFKYTNAR